MNPALRIEDLESSHPQSYVVTSTGPAADLCPEALGIFLRTNKTYNQFPVYKNINGTFVLRQRYNYDDGNQWTISHSTENVQDIELYQNGYDLAFPKTNFPWVVKFEKTKFTKDYSLKVFSGDEKENRTSIFLSNSEGSFLDQNTNHNIIVIIIVISAVFLLLFFIVVIRKRRQKSKDKRICSIDINPVYGDIYYESSTINDRNIYYDT